MIAVLVHVPRIFDPTIHRWAYVAAITYTGYAVILALLVGVLLNQLGKEHSHAAAGRL